MLDGGVERRREGWRSSAWRREEASRQGKGKQRGGEEVGGVAPEGEEAGHRPPRSLPPGRESRRGAGGTGATEVKGWRHTGDEITRSSSASSKAIDRETVDSERDPAPHKALSSEDSSASNSNLVFGYLNLFSDGVHNFTDGMALGSAFVLHGSVGGWSRTLFLLAHELPQEVGDFGILVRSGFTVSKALFFNFLSALVALAGTALALSLGKDPGHSSLIEGFTAGGFIYIAVAGVLPGMNDQKTTLKSSIIQLISLTMGMLVAFGISLVE